MKVRKRADSEPESDTKGELEKTGSFVPIPFPNTVTLVDPPGTLETTTPRFARLLTSPSVVMVMVPLLVVVVGLTLTVIGQLALSATSKTMAKERFVEQTASAAVRVESALAQADPLLDELAALSRRTFSDSAEVTIVGSQMRDLLIARPAISQAYAGFSDGSFMSAGPGRAGETQFSVTREGRNTVYTLRSQGLRRGEERSSEYDPRTRAWYSKAAATGSRVWSDPYVFYFNRHPGVTRSHPVYAQTEPRSLIAVVGVDFDVQALTAFMKAGESGKEGARSVVFSKEGVVLAYPYGAGRLAALPETNQVVTHTSLGDPALSALIDDIMARPKKARNVELFRFSANGTKMLASVRALGPNGPEWYVASFSDEASILHELHTHRARSLWIGGVSLSLAVLVGWWLAKYILRVKLQATEARAAAERAQEQVKDLGSYRLIALLGEGGMGEVWRAHHRLLARDAAIKLIKLGRPGGVRREEQRQRFRREAQAIAKLRSRNTVALFDYGVTPDDTLFYVMELLDGIDLSRLVTQHGPQPPDRVRQIMIQACNSLSEAHQAQLIHRDIKPANLFLCREAEEVDIVKILDFGLVFQATAGDDTRLSDGFADPNAPTLPGNKRTSSPVPKVETPAPEVEPPGVEMPVERASDLLERITNPEQQMGTPAFMSPEQALGLTVDHRTDLYSLGCVAWWLLTGRPPYRAESQLGYMIQHIEGRLTDLRKLAPTISDGFVEIIESCLNKDPWQRPASARALAEALRRVDPGGAPFSRLDAQEWWERHRPPRDRLEPNESLAPLRDVEIVGPRPA